MEEIENGIRITHEWLGHHQIVECHYDKWGTKRLELIVRDDVENVKTKVYLSEQETAYFLAWMATWYE